MRIKFDGWDCSLRFRTINWNTIHVCRLLTS
jgi:hypothetical protein